MAPIRLQNPKANPSIRVMAAKIAPLHPKPHLRKGLLVGEGGRSEWNEDRPGEGVFGFSAICKLPLTRHLTSFGATLSRKGRGEASGTRIGRVRGNCSQEPLTRLADFVRSPPSPARGEGKRVCCPAFATIPQGERGNEYAAQANRICRD